MTRDETPRDPLRDAAQAVLDAVEGVPLGPGMTLTPSITLHAEVIDRLRAALASSTQDDCNERIARAVEAGREQGRSEVASSTQDAPPLRDQFASVATLPGEPGYPEPHYFRDAASSTQDALDVDPNDDGVHLTHLGPLPEPIPTLDVTALTQAIAQMFPGWLDEAPGTAEAWGEMRDYATSIATEYAAILAARDQQ